MFVHNIDPVFLNFGPFQIRYYGLFFAISVVIAVFLIKYLAKTRHLKAITDEVIYECTTYLLIGGLIGARVVYILTNDLMYYIRNPFEIIAFWHGGLAFYGAILGAVAAGYFYSRVKKIDFYDIGDLYVVPLAFGLFLGRIANFINSEAYGKIAQVSWCVQFRNAEGCRYPSQLFEAAKNLLIFGFLMFQNKKKHKKGYFFWSFFLLYSLLRFVIEFYRESEYYLYGLSAGQIASIGVFALSLIMLLQISKKPRHI